MSLVRSLLAAAACNECTETDCLEIFGGAVLSIRLDMTYSGPYIVLRMYVYLPTWAVLRYLTSVPRHVHAMYMCRH